MQVTQATVAPEMELYKQQQPLDVHQCKHVVLKPEMLILGVQKVQIFGFIFQVILDIDMLKCVKKTRFDFKLLLISW